MSKMTPAMTSLSVVSVKRWVPREGQINHVSKRSGEHRPEDIICEHDCCYVALIHTQQVYIPVPSFRNSVCLCSLCGTH